MRTTREKISDLLGDRSKLLPKRTSKRLILAEKTALFMSRDVFSTGNICDMLEVSAKVVANWYDSGRFGEFGYRNPGTRDRRIPKPAFIKFLQKERLLYHLSWVNNIVTPVVSCLGFTENQIDLLRRQFNEGQLQLIQHENMLCFQHEIYNKPPLFIVLFGGSSVLPEHVLEAATNAHPGYPITYIFYGATSEPEAASIRGKNFLTVFEDDGIPAVANLIKREITHFR